MAVSRHLGFYRTANSAIRFAGPENPGLKPNVEWIQCIVCEITVTLKLRFGVTQGHRKWHYSIQHIRLYSVSKKSPLRFPDIFPKRLGIFSPNFIRLLYVHIYAGLQIFIQLPATLTKLRHIKRDHHYMLKMSTIGQNARWVVALNIP